MTYNRPRTVRTGYWITFAGIVIPAIILYLDNHHYARWMHPFARYCWLHLPVFIPAALITLAILNRRCRKEHTRWQRVSLHFAKAVFLITWMASLAPLILIMVLAQTWPLNLLHGPDTSYSREGFTKLAGVAPPSAVHNIYYREDDAFRDVRKRLRFDTQDPEAVQQLIRNQNLAESSDTKRGIHSAHEPDWWHEKQRRKNLKCYYRERLHGYYWFLWYDHETGTVWYEEFSI